MINATPIQIAERALQQAQRYARDRIQSARAGSPSRELFAVHWASRVRRPAPIASCR